MAVGRTCADDPEPLPYRISPFTRVKRPIGCSLCRRRALTTAARAAAAQPRPQSAVRRRRRGGRAVAPVEESPRSERLRKLRRCRRA